MINIFCLWYMFLIDLYIIPSAYGIVKNTHHNPLCTVRKLMSGMSSGNLNLLQLPLYTTLIYTLSITI